MLSKYKYIVNCYSKGSKVRLHKMLDLCTSLHAFVYGIEISQNGEKVARCCIPACEVDCFSIRLNKNSHQRQIPNGILYAFEKKMGSLNFRRSFHNFDDFFEYVAANCGLKNGHCLLVYDFCLRKGQHMSPKIEPNHHQVNVDQCFGNLPPFYLLKDGTRYECKRQQDRDDGFDFE